MAKIDQARSSSDELLRLLMAHPGVLSAEPGDSFLSFDQGPWHRSVSKDLGVPLRGIVELIDNNPMVCSDSFGLPDSASTLALVAFGPLAEAGLLTETPTLLTNIPDADEKKIASYLGDLGWTRGVDVSSEEIDLGEVVAATAIASIRTPDVIEDIDDLFEERFGRSFYVRRVEDGAWDASLVSGKPFIAYRLRIAQDHPNSLLTIQLMADRHGRVGVAGAIHAMNVMAGFEESVGMPG